MGARSKECVGDAVANGGEADEPLTDGEPIAQAALNAVFRKREKGSG